MIATPELTAAWATLRDSLPAALTPIETGEQLARATADLEALLNEIGEDAAHPLGDLARLLIERITAYEAAAHPIPEATPAQMLAFYMESHDLTQAQLAELTGFAQPMISRFLTGKREIGTDHARVLARVFGVQPGMFV